MNFVGSFNNSSDINKGNRRWQNLFGMEDLRQFSEARIWNTYYAHIWLDSCEGIVGSKDIVLGERVK